MKLLIIESPGKIKKLRAILGDEFRVVASIGHVRDLPTTGIAVEAPDFAPKYELTTRGKEVIAGLQPLVERASEVFLATDPDREGESISWHLKQALGLKAPKRVTFNKITPEAVRAGISAPGTINMRTVVAQEARRVLDRLVGYMVSPELCRRIGGKQAAGRVQSVALRILVDRERAIASFRKTTHFGARLTFGDGDGAWSAVWRLKPDFVNDAAPHFVDREFADIVGSIRSLRIVSCESGEARRSPPGPFMTSTMQQAAIVRLGFDPEATMAAAQALYEQGHITYHRTDNPNLAAEDWEQVRMEIGRLGLEAAPSIRVFKAKEGAQAGHPGITPSHWEVAEAGDTETQRALYRLIRQRALASQMKDARYAMRHAVLSATTPDGRAVAFDARGRMLVESGWTALAVADEEEDEAEDNTAYNPVPELRPGQPVTAHGGERTQSDTKPPKRYTQASLIKKLEGEGIGRPSTYAAILGSLVARQYAKVDRSKMFLPTEAGVAVVDMLVGRFGFMELSFTRALESELDEIANGRQNYRPSVAALYDQLVRELADLAASVPVKPSEGMVSAVLAKAKRESIEVPAGTLESVGACEKFLGPRKAKGFDAALASVKQMALVRRLVDDETIKAPDGYPNEMSAKVASKAIERGLRKAGKGKRSTK